MQAAHICEYISNAQSKILELIETIWKLRYNCSEIHFFSGVICLNGGADYGTV